jgi:L-alanine-DL-glutamate epimerase-like enolase superfamily enzyme
MKPTDIRIDQVTFGYEDFRYRTPIKFGGTALDRVTLLNVTITVTTREGRRARGFGSMPLGNIWSFPSKVLGYDKTLAAMKELSQRIAKITADHKEFGHPIDLALTLEPYFADAALELSKQLPEPIPILCALVCASPFDAALHDAFGKAHGLNCYQTYGPEFMNHDLEHYLGADFKGESLEQYVRRSPQPRLPVYHLVGALDPLESADVATPIGDRLPETLSEWIARDGLTHLKIKLNGDNLAWDVERVLRVDRVASGDKTLAFPRPSPLAPRLSFSLDFNERCPNVDYLLEFLAKVREQSPEGFERIQYIEQPTARTLKDAPEMDMHKASQLRPVVIDESLVDLDSLKLARTLGYTGAALKACKGQSHTLLLAAAAQKYGMFLCVQDLTCPGASLIHSAGLAAHIPGVVAIEANARQYVPSANKMWEARFPGIFTINDGVMATETLTGLGLGAV